MPFVKGQSGNPRGRPKLDLKVVSVREAARERTGQAIATLVEIMTSKKASPQARVAAANSLLDRGYGKPSQEVQMHTEGSINVTIRVEGDDG